MIYQIKKLLEISWEKQFDIDKISLKENLTSPIEHDKLVAPTLIFFAQTMKIKFRQIHIDIPIVVIWTSV